MKYKILLYMNPFDTQRINSFSNFSAIAPLFLILIIFVGVATNMTEEHNIAKEIQIMIPDNQRFKKLQTPDNGTIRLIKGKVKIEFPKGTDLDKFNDENVSDFFKKKKTKKSKSKK